MKAEFVHDSETLQVIYDCANMQHNLLEIMPGHDDIDFLIDYLIDNSWLVAITEGDLILGYLLIEWIDSSKGRAIIHVCKLNKCNGLEAWNKTIPLIKDYVKVLMAYIPETQKGLLRLTRQAGFKMKYIETRKLYFARKTF